MSVYYAWLCTWWFLCVVTSTHPHGLRSARTEFTAVACRVPQYWVGNYWHPLYAPAGKQCDLVVWLLPTVAHSPKHSTCVVTSSSSSVCAPPRIGYMDDSLCWILMRFLCHYIPLVKTRQHYNMQIYVNFKILIWMLGNLLKAFANFFLNSTYNQIFVWRISIWQLKMISTLNILVWMWT